ncbi:hypothetical protein [uncultured Ruminococcus sp.]|uniref:hypothetical protein n=1 Tax=uncultured Ruminococcus sp. TaxID=165186 RepID=UPI0025EA2645|nr:hypothetical protein [uncultured Ruminococcus sp.]
MYTYCIITQNDESEESLTADSFTIEEACRTCASRMLLADIGAFVGSLTPDKLGNYIGRIFS